MKGSKKYCFIVPTLHAGGVENYVLRFLRYMAKQPQLAGTAFSRPAFTVMSLGRERGDLHDQYVQTGCSIVYQSVGYLNVKALMGFYRFIRKNEFDTLVDFTGNFGGLRMAVAKLAGLQNRIVFYRRSNDGFKPGFIKNNYNRFENRMVYTFSNKIFSNSIHAFDYFFSTEYQDDPRFKVIRNGMDTDRFFREDSKNVGHARYGIPDHHFVVGHVGRFDPAKNHPTIFEVAKEILNTAQDVIFVFCGKGTDSHDFKQELINYGIQDNCICLGVQEDVNAILNLFDVFYFPSLAEGQPNALIEAMLVDLKIVASNIPPIKETMPVEVHAELVDPLNIPEQVKALLRIKDAAQTGNQKDEKKGFRSWAEEHYSSSKNFKLFENEL